MNDITLYILEKNAGMFGKAKNFIKNQYHITTGRKYKDAIKKYNNFVDDNPLDRLHKEYEEAVKIYRDKLKKTDL